jgi:hypothetical protein
MICASITIVVYKATIIFWKVVFGKPLSKLSYICLSLRNLVNEKHFSVKEKFRFVLLNCFYIFKLF